MKDTIQQAELSKEAIEKIYKIPSQTSVYDKCALELIEKILIEYTREGSYTYCETGSYMGGTLLPRLANEKCKSALSIDKRVDHQDDERREEGYSYTGYTTEMMIKNIKATIGEKEIKKLETFEGSINSYHNSVKTNEETKFDWVFIDAEHTNIASFDDFLTSLKLLKPNGIISMHDSWMIYSAISNIRSYLENQNIDYTFGHINGDVTSFFIGELSSISNEHKDLFLDTDIESFIEISKKKLWNFQSYAITEKAKNKNISKESQYATNWFVPNSAMNEELRKTLPTLVASRTPNALMRVFRKLHNENSNNIIRLSEIVLSRSQRKRAEELKLLFDGNGSDKCNNHYYHLIYAIILDLLPKEIRLLEIGLGTKDKSIASHMGFKKSSPGGSLRSFKEYLNGSVIHGADIDPGIKIEDCRIFNIDQTKPESFEVIVKEGESCYDLIIDDGLHSPDANLNTLEFALNMLSPEGFLVIEDISGNALDIWRVVGYQLQDKGYNCKIIKEDEEYIFLMTKHNNMSRIM